MKHMYTTYLHIGVGHISRPPSRKRNG